MSLIPNHAIAAGPGGEIGRLLTAMIIPCDPSTGAVAISDLHHIVDHQVGKGVDGLFLLGTAGQGPLLSVTERKEVLEAALRAVDGRLSVVCHVGAGTTRDTLELAVHAAEAGATAIASVPPVYYTPDEQTVDEYYLALLDATDLPVFAYDNPKATGYAFTVAQLVRLIDAGLAGAKVARNDIVYLQSLIAAGVPTWTANADLNAAGYCAGAHGAISTITNLAPRLFADLREAVHRTDLPAAVELQQRVSAFATGVRAPIIGGLHYGATLLGLPGGAPRRPLRMPNSAEQQRITEALKIESLL